MTEMAKTKKRKLSGYEEFEALSDAEKEKVWESFNREIPFSETRPLSAADRRLHGFAGRAPRVRQDTKAVSITVSRSLLRQADAYAKAHGLTRAQLVAQGLAIVIDPVTPASRSRNGTSPAPRRRKAS